ncbi:hypothetical protein PG996_008067 [Apiospora saccharicola]|uniref:Uncharacterized protein n=1 Tax=Apiospora saccharicola TaxID=335842 RepID=A0ABR1UWY7_9PEZI
MSGLNPDRVTVALRDGNKVAEVLPIFDQTIEAVGGNFEQRIAQDNPEELRAVVRTVIRNMIKWPSTTQGLKGRLRLASRPKGSRSSPSSRCTGQSRCAPSACRKNRKRRSTRGGCAA